MESCLKYQKTTKASLKKEYKEISKLVSEAEEKGLISDKDLQIAMPSEPTPARMYCNIKDHKAVREDIGIPPVREIVSCSGSNTEGLGKILDHYIRPVDESASSYIRDTPHVLRMFRELNEKGPQPRGMCLFTMDVVAMYPSIPTARGPEVLQRALDKAGIRPELVDWLVRATKASLAHNTFEFDSQLYKQIEGAAIGGPASCSYSGVFMEHIETTGLKKFEDCIESQEEEGGGKVHWFKRFRDDCLGLFMGTEQEFCQLLNIMNEVDPSIKLTAELDTESKGVIFLDLRVSIDSDGFIQTTLYEKPNQKNVLLLPTSCHPPSTTRGSVFSLALRIKRICSDDVQTELEFKKLVDKLRERGYKEDIISNGIERAREIDRQEALKEIKSRGEKNLSI